jgi:diphosphomevalonate decarboxylase
MAKLKEAITNKKFDTFARLTIEDSNEFHAICLDSYPPIIYLNSYSVSIIKSLSFINSFYKKEIVSNL